MTVRKVYFNYYIQLYIVIWLNLFVILCIVGTQPDIMKNKFVI